MTLIAQRLSRSSYCLRSGGAEGSDDAFESGAEYKQIFLPWDGFNGKKADNRQYFAPQENLDLVKKYHPNFSRLSQAGRKLMSRNSNQVLGPDLNDPVDFILCWTKDGKASGGTGQALRMAKDYNIPIFNLKNGYDDFASYMTVELLLK